MKLSEFIGHLQKLHEENGDIDVLVTVPGFSPDFGCNLATKELCTVRETEAFERDCEGVTTDKFLSIGS